MIVCIAEKPSVAKDIARIIGATHSHDGYMEGNGYQVTWTFGHLCTLKEPDDYTTAWKPWSLAALPTEVINFGLTGRTFHIYIKPRVFVTKKVQEINHINYDDYKKYWEYYNQDTKTQLQNFLEFIGEDSYLVAHNAIFDYYFLNAELKYWGLPEVSSERFRCTLRTVKKYFKSEGIDVPNNKLITCCEYFKILVNDNEGSFHNALFDTIMTSKLFIHLYKKFAKIDDFNVNEYNNKYAHFQYCNLQRNNKKKQENKESSNDKKKFNKKEYNNKKNNNDNEEIPNNKNESNEDNESKLNGMELNKLIQKMNEMVIKEQNNESKKEQ